MTWRKGSDGDWINPVPVGYPDTEDPDVCGECNGSGGWDSLEDTGWEWIPCPECALLQHTAEDLLPPVSAYALLKKEEYSL